MPPDRVYVEVLGPLRVRDAVGRDITPTGALQRRLLALLVLRRGSTVSGDAAADALWPGRLPQDPGAALQNHVMRLRRVLPAGLLASVGSSYRLDAERVTVDADRLVMLLGEDPQAGAAELRELLAGWSGRAYPELDEVDEARVDAARLEELRQRAQEVVAEARLTAGDLDGLVTELAALVHADPLRERPRELLMAALAAAGRTVEALRVFDEFRRLIGDELGIEPSPVLVAQHAALLAGTGTGSFHVRSQLPVSATPLVGRDALASELVERVEAARVLTLVGPGGVGKTRLLVELGHRSLARRPDRPVVLCELAQADAASVADVVTAALSIDGRSGTAQVDRIVEVLGADELVVLLDNCEHVLDSTAELVAGVIGRCPKVTIIATSRERLRVEGEQLVAVPTLPTGGDDAPAVELFRQRATAVSSAFEPDAAQLAEIVDIVGRLDGLPLAIELAAARLHTLEVTEVAAGLDQRFELLSTGLRTSARHASLTAAVSWSFDSLDAELQRVFASLSVFSRPFTATDAAAVSAIPEAAAAERLSRLVERSLVQRAPGRRYVLLETLRAYGADQLASSDDLAHVSERHSRWMVDWVEHADRALSRPGRPVLTEIDAAVPELRVALAWLIDHGLLEHAGRLVVGLVNYGFLRLRPDVLRWADAVLAADTDDHVSVAPALWAASAYASWMGGDVQTAAALIERALQVEQTAGAGRAVPRVRVVRGNIGLFEGRLSEAADWYLQAIDAAGDDEPERLFARATLLLALGYAGDESALDLADELVRQVGDSVTPNGAYVWYCAGEADLSFDAGRARTRLVRAIELAEATNASFVRGIAGASKASIEARSGDPEVAMADYRWLIEHWRRAGMWSTQWTMLRSVATLLERVGRCHDAAVLEGAVRSTHAGHRIFGADEAALDELSSRLRAELGDDAYAAALQQGAVLDGSAAVEHALRAL